MSDTLELPTDDDVREAVFAILDGWTDTLAVNFGPHWTLAGTGPDGVRRSGSNADPIALAHKLFAQGQLRPEPEPVAETVTPDEPVLTPGDAPADASLEDDEGGSFYDDGGDDEPDLVGGILDEIALDELDELAPGGVGVMVNNTGGVMAADRTEELRAKRIGETVMEHRRLVDASYTFEEARTLQRLRSKMNAAVDRTGEPLTEDEERELDRLAIEELWAGRMDTELQRRLSMLNEANGDTLQTYNAREGWADL